MRVIVTGATGFIGRKLIEELRDAGHDVVAAVRRQNDAVKLLPGVGLAVVGDLLVADWQPLLIGVDAVVHLAARVHVMCDDSVDPLAAFRRVNVDGTRRLVEASVAAGVKRFVYVSSIKVNGDATKSRAFRPDDNPAPSDAYGVSKLEAERVVAGACSASDMSHVIVRPPLVYGPGVGGNFLRLVRWIEKGVPLPLAAVDNRRSIVSLENLASLLATCISHPAAANQVFLVADGKDWATPELIREISGALGRPTRMFSLSPSLLWLIGSLLGKGAAIERLCGSLQVDDSLTRTRLGWRPPESSVVALRRAVKTISGEHLRG